MQFIRDNVLVRETNAPEDLLTAIAGGFGRWQIYVMIAAFIGKFFHGIDIYSIRTASPSNLNFTCKDGNGSQCFTANGSACKEFVFHTPYKMKSFTENFGLVCGKEGYIVWSEHCHRFGLFLGSTLTGACADKLGLKITSMAFMALHCLSGLLTISMRNYEILMVFDFIHGFCSTFLYSFTTIAVCHTVGNEQRTLAMGVALLPIPICLTCYQVTHYVFEDITGLVAFVSALPLLILIPLLYYKDSPTYRLMMMDYIKAEDVLREIASINKRPIAADARLRPVQILFDKNTKQSSYCMIWAHSETRKAYSVIFLLWFFEGISVGVLMHNVYANLEDVMLYGACGIVGCTLSIILCHYVHQKYVICVFSVLKGGTILGVHLIATSHREVTMIYKVLKLVSGVLAWISYSALETLTPMMFPTEMRAFYFGLCIGLFHLSYLVATQLVYQVDRQIVWGLGALVLISALLQAVAVCWSWKVNKRELPDYLRDCVFFEKHFKPVRYLMIREVVASEIEVANVEFNKDLWWKRKP